MNAANHSRRLPLSDITLVSIQQGTQQEHKDAQPLKAALQEEVGVHIAGPTKPLDLLQIEAGYEYFLEQVRQLSIFLLRYTKLQQSYSPRLLMPSRF